MPAGSESPVSYRNLVTTIKYHEQTVNLSRFPVDFGYMETMNLRLKEGRFFDRAIQSDKIESVIVNESFVKKMGWENYCILCQVSIRKVFGASIFSIFKLMNGDYLWIVVIAFTAGAQLGFCLMNKMLFPHN